MQSPTNWEHLLLAMKWKVFFNFAAFIETSRDLDFVQQASLAKISEISVPSSKLKVNAGSFQLLLCQSVNFHFILCLSLSIHQPVQPPANPFELT